MPFTPNAVHAQIGLRVRLTLDIRISDWAYDLKAQSVHFRVGPRRAGRTATVHLNPRDLYDVTIGHVDRQAQWVVDAKAVDIDAASLPSTLLSLHDQAAGQ